MSDRWRISIWTIFTFRKERRGFREIHCTTIQPIWNDWFQILLVCVIRCVNKTKHNTPGFHINFCKLSTSHRSLWTFHFCNFFNDLWWQCQTVRFRNHKQHYIHHNLWSVTFNLSIFNQLQLSCQWQNDGLGLRISSGIIFKFKINYLLLTWCERLVKETFTSENYNVIQAS